MSNETPVQKKPNGESPDSDDSVLTYQKWRSDTVSAGITTTRSIAIAATFSVEPLRPPLEFWMRELDISIDIVLTPYAQVIQQLLDPRSEFSLNKSGLNILVIRLEDWLRDRRAQDVVDNLHHVRAVGRDLVAAIRAMRSRTRASTLVFFSILSPSLPIECVTGLEEIQNELIAQLDALEGIHCLTHASLSRLYPVTSCEDPVSDRIGHIPYTNEYFVAIATLLARRIAALLKPQYKVIALDCDNTLWQGICGEDGAAGVRLTPAHLEFQRMLVRQHDAGMLLCLCTKNNPQDVAAVFSARQEMPLREEHIVSSRVNWNSKSSNLKSIADDLDLSLDSFIFVDDSPLECAEVREHCPTVLTLQFPDTPEAIARFMDHVWAFDRVEVTAEAKGRTAQYKQNRARNEALKDSVDLAQFLESLQVKVEVSPMQPEHVARVAELTQRTNQFNLTNIRRRSGEIEALRNSNALQCLVIHVRDRFGDYGLVGALLFQREDSVIEVDTFVLSCRVLGRGVEHRIVGELAKIARQQKAHYISLKYRRTERNAPAREFLEKSFMQFRSARECDDPPGTEVIYKIPLKDAERAETLAVSGADKRSAGPAAPQIAVESTSSVAWHEAAYRLSHIGDIVQRVDQSARRVRSGRTVYVAPRTASEEAVAAIWSQLLGLDQVGAHDDFFELGGDSVMAVQMISRIGSVLGLEVSLHEFFEGPTVEGIAGKLVGAVQLSSPIQPQPRNRPVPLSWSQQRLWFIDQLEGGSSAYHIPVAIRLRGALHQCALKGALDAIVNRHEVLRTVFVRLNGEAIQKITSERSFALVIVDLKGSSEAEAEVNRQLLGESAAAFDLGTGPLIRGKLLELARDDHVLLITMHHMVADGWSIGILIRELGLLYEEYRSGRPARLPDLPVQYADYAWWQRQWLTASRLREQLGYWNDHLRGAPELLELPTDRPRPAMQSYRGASISLSFSPDLTASLKDLARRINLTLAMALHTAWLILLSRVSGQDDIVVGMPVANRRRTELEGLIGFFVNTLAIRTRLQDDLRVVDLLQHVKQAMLGAYANQDVPFEQVVESLQPVRSLSHSPIFQVMFVLHNAPRALMQLQGLTVAEQEVPTQTAQFDLTLSLQESSDGIVGSLNYASDLFDTGTIQKWVGSFENILKEMVRDCHVLVSRLPLLNAADRRAVIVLPNTARAAYPQDKLIHELFEEQVRRTPEALAVVYERESLTYAKLNSKANELARRLRDKGVGPDELVGICVERGLQMMVGMMGILKAGGAYVPLDPTYPAERLRYMVENAAPRLLLTQEKLREQLPSEVCEVLTLASQCDEAVASNCENLDARSQGLTSSNLAYVIYTSGSTGNPKGVMIEHRNVLNLWRGLEQLYPKFPRCQRVALNASFNFDASVQQFVQLLSGRTVFVIPQEQRQDAAMLLNFIAEHRIQGIDCTPSQLRSWIAAGLLKSDARPLVMVLVGGEAIDAELWASLAHCTATEFFNVYGPTECTVDATVVRLQRDTTQPHIGRSMLNRSVYLLDRYEQPVPLGVVGEIYIGGAGVGRGYLNQPELTAERFLADPFSIDTNARMYKTGDLGRLRSDGAIEYRGRNDHQVKVRGYRIELGEIEMQLVRHAEVGAAVVIAHEDIPGEKRLVAYVVPSAPAAAPSVEALRMHLGKVLPGYMVPSVFVMLERLPLTQSGKLDRRALPSPELGVHASRQYEAPQGEVEEILAGIWSTLLRVPRVGRWDNFFELGGHSLLIVQLMERLRRVGLSTQMRCVFESPTLADLANTLTNEAGEQVEVPPNLIPPNCEAVTPEMLPLVVLEAEHIERIVQSVPGGAANIQDIYPLAPLQEGILFHHLLDEDKGDTYVLPMVLSVRSGQRLQELIAALQAVINRHDVLRTAVLWEDLPQPVQVVYRHVTLPVAEIALDHERDATEQIREWIKPEGQRLDLRKAPPIQMRVAPDPNSEQWYVLLQLHHITSDHVTVEIVTAEVVAYLEERAQALPESVPYRNHVAQAVTYARTHDAEAFFRSKLAEIDEPTAPFGLLDVYGDGTQVDEACDRLDSDLAQRVRTQSRRLAVSAATLFHAAWGLVIAHTSGRSDVVFGSVLLGRLQGNAGAQNILGMFINTLPLRLPLEGLTAVGLVERTQRELVELLGHEQASLAAAQRCSGIVGSAPLFTALFNYRHSVPNPEARWSGARDVRMLAVQERTNYPIVMSVDDLGDAFTLTAQTDRRVDPRRLTGYLQEAVKSLVGALEQAPHTTALSLPILPHDERYRMLEMFNATHMPYPQEKLIHQLFEEQVERTPHATAVICRDQYLTYRQLNSRANQLAHYLRKRDVGPECFVGLYVERGIEMIVGVLGILKAGGAYVPLDPNYPQERLEFVLSDTAPKAVLTQESLRHMPLATGAIALDGQRSEIAQEPATNFGPELTGVSSSNLAYVIYTSGSTGRPKGVAIEHRNAVNLVCWATSTMAWEAFNQTLHSTSMNFDLSVYECFVPLAIGGSVRVVYDALALLYEPPGVTLINTVPSAIKGILDAWRVPETTRVVNLAGEALKQELVERIFEHSAVETVCNLYGPSETTTYSTWISMSRQEGFIASIGRPIANTQIYILDRNGQLAPLGVVGEIYIGGAGVARGYLNQPEMTAERFIRHPFSTDACARLYRTGDLGRWRLDGTIEYLGRHDHQVKIRGFRIELGEIEARLASLPQVKECAVIAREDVPGEKCLVAYVVPSDSSGAATAPKTEELRMHLKATLPDYMVPGAFLTLERLPMTANGKLDRRALPSPELGSYPSQRYLVPQGEVEETLAQIWREVLQAERVGRQDNFFELGGHSLLALKALLRINHSFDAALKVTDIYKSPTIQEMAGQIAGSTTEDKFVDLSREAALDGELHWKPYTQSAPARNVMLTGGTGFVGRFLLAQLLNDTEATVYCLVRAESERHGLSRIKATLLRWDLWRPEFEHRIVAIPGDLRLPRLGVDKHDYESLCQDIDSIYHCATSMNHLETYAMAKPANVAAARELVKLATLNKPKLINYMSTLGVFSSSEVTAARVVNEHSSIDHEKHRSSSGYAASKWVAEKIFLTASEKGIPCNIFRLGLVWADSREGRFDELQNVYRVLKTCLMSGYGIENYRYAMPPTPVDYVASAVVYLAQKHLNGGKIFHISSSGQLIDRVFEVCNEVAGTSLELISHYDWISEVKRLHQEGYLLPALPLVEFAFSMDEESFYRYQHRMQLIATRFDCTRTHNELEQAGIVAPMLNGELLKVCIEGMLSRDAQLREFANGRSGPYAGSSADTAKSNLSTA
jgi:amino acid adenylation domain-containing protein/FkbH-like protein/thioester reductase-like protein